MKKSGLGKTVLTILGVVIGFFLNSYVTSVMTASKVSYDYGAITKTVTRLERDYNEKVEPLIATVPSISNEMKIIDGRVNKLENKTDELTIIINRTANLAGKAKDEAERATASIINYSNKLDDINLRMGEMSLTLMSVKTGIDYLQKGIIKN